MFFFVGQDIQYIKNCIRMWCYCNVVLQWHTYIVRHYILLFLIETKFGIYLFIWSYVFAFFCICNRVIIMIFVCNNEVCHRSYLWLLQGAGVTWGWLVDNNIYAMSSAHPSSCIWEWLVEANMYVTGISILVKSTLNRLYVKWLKIKLIHTFFSKLP